MTTTEKDKLEAFELELVRMEYVGDAERPLQDALEKLLKQHDLTYWREHEFGPRDRVDFFLEDFGIALEVKTKSGADSVLRQLWRYAKHGCVKRIVLVTTRWAHKAMPEEINGKKVVVLCLSSL